jgi:hypothetical protein
MRVKPEGLGVMHCQWPRSITAMTNKKKVMNWRREDTKRPVDASNEAAVLKWRTEIGFLISEVAGGQEFKIRKSEGRMSFVSFASCVGPTNEGLADPGHSSVLRVACLSAMVD